VRIVVYAPHERPVVQHRACVAAYERQREYGGKQEPAQDRSREGRRLQDFHLVYSRSQFGLTPGHKEMGDPRREHEQRDRYQDPPAGDRPDHRLERESERGHEQHQRGQAEERERHGEDRPILAFGGTATEVRPEPGEEHHERAHDSNGERYTQPQNTRRYQRYGGNQRHRERR